MSYPGTPWRERAREQFETLLDTIDAEWTTPNANRAARDVAERARSQFSESLNQGLRRIRETKTLEDAAIVAVEITAPFAARCRRFCLCRRSGDGARRPRSRLLAAFVFIPLTAPLSAPASIPQDPVIAIAAASEISPELAARVEIDNQTSDHADRVFLPAVARSPGSPRHFIRRRRRPACSNGVGRRHRLHSDGVRHPHRPF